MKGSTTLRVDGVDIAVTERPQGQYLSLTNMADSQDDGVAFVDYWLRNKSTLEFIAAWEGLHNPDFKPVDFDGFLSKAGGNTFRVSAKQLKERAGCIGIFTKSGRNGGTFAHEDIAIHFASWISPLFQLYLIKEFRRLKEDEGRTLNIEWQTRRALSKVFYRTHTDAVQTHVIPMAKASNKDIGSVYAKEADLLSMAVFGCTAQAWREANVEHANQGKNIRDVATMEQLAVLTTVQGLNAQFIEGGMPLPERLAKLTEVAQETLKRLNAQQFINMVKKSIPPDDPSKS